MQPNTWQRVTKYLGLLLLVLTLVPTSLSAQVGVIEGQALDRTTRAPLAGAVIQVEGPGGQASALTGQDGRFRIPGLSADLYALRGSYIGYAPFLVTDVLVQSSRPTFVLVEMRTSAIELEGLTVGGDPFEIPEAATVSATLLSAEEVRRTPGGQQDISRTLLSLPGVIGGVDNRNDLLVRGGGPGENAYYLDGIRIPQINHFATQGATGGAVGLINVDFIRETEFLAGGFPARYGNALSSVLIVKNRPGTRDGVRGDFTLGAAEAALTLDGPVGEQGNWLFSVRRSYLQFILEAVGLPIRPDYWDGQARVELFPSSRDRLVFVGIGAIDEFDLVEPEAGDIENEDIFNRVLDNDQKSYTAGATWERQLSSGVAKLTVSRSWTDYQFRDLDNNNVEVLRNGSTEFEMPVRLEGDFRVTDNVDLEVGLTTSQVGLDLDLFQRATPGSPFPSDIVTGSELRAWRSGGFAQTVLRLAEERLTLTSGIRGDYDSALEDGWAVSPRLGAAFQLNPRWTLSAGAGVFAQSPTLLSLGVEEGGLPVNRGLRQIQNRQLIGGIAWRPSEALRVKTEVFYKGYSDYPVSRDDPRISQANLGGDYGFIGAEPLTSDGEGRAYGAELFAQRKLTESFYLLGAYTWSKSEFTGADGVYKPSSWDVRHAVDLTAGYRPNRRWEIGTKVRFLSGRPFTPFDAVRSAAEYPLTGRGVPDWDRIGAERTDAYLRWDIRVERQFDFGGWNGRLYLDVQNVLNRENGIGFEYTQDPLFPDNRRPQDGTQLLPFFGLSIEF